MPGETEAQMKLETVELNRITINDGFWNKHIRLVREVILPYQWDAINDRIPDAESSHSLENFKIAAGRSGGEYYGAVFQDTDIAKWLEAVGFTLSNYKDEALEKTADEVIELIAQAQCGDGYLNTYFTVKEPDKRWCDLCEGHELYTAGHMIEAAVAYYQGTGKRKLLDCMIRFADLICETFGDGEGQIPGYPGHQEIELALVKLYRVTGNRNYLDTAKAFLERRGVGENYFMKEMKSEKYMHLFPEFKNYDTSYSQSHMPVRMQSSAQGHAVRAVYMYSAMTDIAREFHDAEMAAACERLWNNIVGRQMYITGSIGSSGLLERFTCDYDLPNSFNYSETCASIGLAMFGMRMGNMTGNGKYFDVVERALYNTVLAGVALDGKSFFYVNPLEVWPASCMDRTSREHVKPVRQKWFGVACCPPNVARTLASLGQYLYSVSGEELFVNLFISNESRITVGGSEVEVTLQTEFPWKNEITAVFQGVPEGGIKAAFRIPEYAACFKMEDAHGAADFIVEKQYAHIGLAGDCTVRISFESPARFVRANPKVRADNGKVSLVRGPLVYCLEEVDNGENLSAVFADTRIVPEEEVLPELGGIVALHFKGKRRKDDWKENVLYKECTPEFEEASLKAVPYAYWGNRGPGEMSVWMKEFLSE